MHWESIFADIVTATRYWQRALFAVILVAATPLAAAEKCIGWRSPVGKKIVGGERATLAQWPSIAALRLTSPKSNLAVFICGGSIISPDSILTAAHCFDDIESQPDGRLVSTASPYQGWVLDVVLDSDDLANIKQENVYETSAVEIHQDYHRGEAQQQGNDIAVLRLKRSSSGPFAALSLDSATDPVTPPGAVGVVAGYGLTNGIQFGGGLQRHDRADGSAVFAGSRRLLHVGVPIIATSDCSARWREILADGQKDLVADGQICAGFEAETIVGDSCSGDSGGPIVTYDTQGCPTQIGLVSWGDVDCGHSQAYGVYTRISHHADWLRRRVPDVKAKRNAPTDAPVGDATDLSAAEFVEQVSASIAGSRGQALIKIREGTNIKVDDTLTFEVLSDVTGRLVIIDVNAAGVATQIFPNEFVDRDDLRLIKAGKSVIVPGAGYGFDHFRAEPPFGNGRLVALVVPPDFPARRFLTAPVRAKGFIPERSTSGYFMNLMQQISSHTAARPSDAEMKAWAITQTEYTIMPR